VLYRYFPGKTVELLFFFLFFLVYWEGVRLSPLSPSATIWPIVPALGDGWCWVWSSRWNDWQGTPKYPQKTCPNANLSTTNPTCLTRARTRAAAVGSQRLTAWIMVRLCGDTNRIFCKWKSGTFVLHTEQIGVAVTWWTCFREVLRPNLSPSFPSTVLLRK
jgi:hypothetical protein